MELEKVSDVVRGIPYMNEKQAALITEFIKTKRLYNVLELGFHHGVSTAYMAAALDELGTGRILTIDLPFAKGLQPNILDILAKLQLEDRVDVVFEEHGYTWHLHKLIEKNSEPIFDLCYIDGAHNWDTDGLAFFLVDRLLVPGGWIIFDDLDWSYGKSPALKDKAHVAAMSEEFRNAAQVRMVFEHLVKKNPGYGEFIVDGAWGFARKLPRELSEGGAIRTEILYRDGPFRELVKVGKSNVKRLLRFASRPRP